MNVEELKKKIRDVPDFPKKGIVFKDITPLLQDGPSFLQVTESIVNRYKDKKIDYVVGVESRGFIFGAPIANYLNIGFVLVRKKGKLPYKTNTFSCELEYGSETLEIHEDSFKPGQDILIVDDVLATGGTVSSVAEMIKSMGGNIVGIEFLIELSFLNGRSKLGDLPSNSLLVY